MWRSIVTSAGFKLIYFVIIPKLSSYISQSTYTEFPKTSNGHHHHCTDNYNKWYIKISLIKVSFQDVISVNTQIKNLHPNWCIYGPNRNHINVNVSLFAAIFKKSQTNYDYLLEMILRHTESANESLF